MSGESEVNQFYPMIFVEQNILGFEVPVRVPTRVNVIEDISQVSEYHFCLLFGQTLLLDQVVKEFAVRAVLVDTHMDREVSDYYSG